MQIRAVVIHHRRPQRQERLGQPRVRPLLALDASHRVDDLFTRIEILRIDRGVEQKQPHAQIVRIQHRNLLPQFLGTVAASQVPIHGRQFEEQPSAVRHIPVRQIGRELGQPFLPARFLIQGHPGFGELQVDVAAELFLRFLQ